MSTTATTAANTAVVRMLILLVRFVLAGIPWLPGRNLLVLVYASRIRVWVRPHDIPCGQSLLDVVEDRPLSRLASAYAD